MMRTTALSLIRESKAWDAWSGQDRGDSADPLSRGLFDQRGQSASGRVACDVPEDLWTGATEFVYERRTQPGSKIGPWQSELEGMLSENASRPKRERMTLMRIFEDLQALGCEGDDDAVRRYASRRAKVRKIGGRNDPGGQVRHQVLLIWRFVSIHLAAFCGREHLFHPVRCAYASEAECLSR